MNLRTLLAAAIVILLAGILSASHVANVSSAIEPTVGANSGVPGQTGFQAQRVSPESIGAPSAPKTALATSSPYVCFHTGSPSPLYSTWGYYPYHQRVRETRDWCGYLGSYQTWRVSSAGLSSLGEWCNPSNAYTQKTAGGNGYYYTTVLSGGHFDCPTNTPPSFIVYHLDDWQKWRCNMDGYCAFVENGRL